MFLVLNEFILYIEWLYACKWIDICCLFFHYPNYIFIVSNLMLLFEFNLGWVIFIVVVKVVGKEEIFNQCHARLRNVIERAFGVVKACFQYWREWHLICLLFKQKLSWHASPFTIFFDKFQLWIDYFLNMTMKWNWKVNANQNQNSTTSSFFVASDQEFMQQFRDQIVNELFQVFN